MKRLIFVFAFLTVSKLFATPEPQLGAVLQHDAVYDVPIVFSEPVDVSTLTDDANYTIGPGTIVGLRLCAQNQGVVLTVTGLQPGDHGSLTVQNINDLSGNVLPPAAFNFNAGNQLWTTIGANELGFPADAAGVTTNGFDVTSGGFQQREEYDEATFVGEKVQGDFEVKVRVDSVEPAGAGAKAGLMIREQLDEGKTRPLDPDDPTQAFSRYLELAISAPTDAVGDVIGGHQIWQRAVSPSIDTISITVTNDADPSFTNAWLRIVRAGQQFTLWRGSDPNSWQQLGSATFDSPFSTNVYVGVAFSPQNADIPPASDLRKSFLAKFRDYSLTAQQTATLRIDVVGDHAEVTWDSGTLETAPTVTGDWTTASSQQSPYRVDFAEAKRFFRLRQ